VKDETKATMDSPKASFVDHLTRLSSIIDQGFKVDSGPKKVYPLTYSSIK